MESPTNESYCIKIYKANGEKIRRLLHSSNLINRELKIVREGDYILIPVNDPNKALDVMRSSGVDFTLCRREFPVYKRQTVIERIGGYIIVGDIAIINFKHDRDLEYYKYLGQKLLNDIPRVKSVYLKMGVKGIYRIPELVHLAGERRTTTMFKEYGLIFNVDVSRTYVNPRLAYEHRRVAEEIPEGSLVLDMFSGIGGFSIHIAALNNAKILSSDINHYAIYYLYKNYISNKKRLKGYINMIRVDAKKLPDVIKPVFTQIIMNNPTLSKTFTNTACKLFDKRVIVYYYTLTISRLEAEDEALSSFTSNCKQPISIDILDSRRVLEYSPTHGIYNVKLAIRKL
ncbi:MAG: hypothetical protein GSR85_04600 [Desulfurococcales archaeon]|nr:hypothetical protein [Desulfurococcales archaeon]